MDVAHQVLGDSVAQDGRTVRLNLPHRFVVKITLCACVHVCVCACTTLNSFQKGCNTNATNISPLDHILHVQMETNA